MKNISPEKKISPEDAQRIKDLDNYYWIGYPKVIEIRDALDSLLTYPKMHRMPNMALIGETNNGKTMLLNKFCSRHMVEPTAQDEKTLLPIVMVQMPPEPDENRFYDVLLERLFADGAPREPVTSKLSRLKRLMAKLETRLIIIDEFQHSLAGHLSKQRKFLNAVKYLGNELHISIVASGTLETLSALQADPQIANRFKPMFLSKWTLDLEFLRLLASMETKLKLKHPSNLGREKIGSLILAEAGGTIGEIRELLNKLATFAIVTGEEKITEEMFDAKILKKAGWLNASDRRKNQE